MLKILLPLLLITLQLLSCSCNRASSEQTHVQAFDEIAESDSANTTVATDSIALFDAAHYVGFEYDCRQHNAPDSICAGYGRNRVAPIRGIVYNTIISEDDVAVRDAPSYESKVLFHLHKFTRIQILGVSRESSLIDNEHWVKVRIKTDNVWLDGEYWIFARNIAYRGGEKIYPAALHTSFENETLIGSYVANGDTGKIVLDITPVTNDAHQNARAFFYCMHREGAHYRLTPGMYLQSDDGSPIHISYKFQTFY